MAKIDRKHMKIFGSGAGTAQLGKFGSLAAGAAATTTDPEEIQSLSNYLTGWYGAVIGSNAPAMEDMNGLCFLFAYQLAYIMQAGIPEWNASTTYYIGSLVNDGYGNIYVSLIDDNTNNALTDNVSWNLPNGKVRTVTNDDTATVLDNLIRVNNTLGAQTETLPAIASTPIGKEIVVKRLATSLYPVTVKGHSTDLIDDANTFVISQIKGALRVKSNGTTWDVV